MGKKCLDALLFLHVKYDMFCEVHLNTNLCTSIKKKSVNRTTRCFIV